MDGDEEESPGAEEEGSLEADEFSSRAVSSGNSLLRVDANKEDSLEEEEDEDEEEPPEPDESPSRLLFCNGDSGERDRIPRRSRSGDGLSRSVAGGSGGVMATSPGAAGWSPGSTLRPIRSSSSSWSRYMNPFLS